jgi:hypothetical protein
LVISDQAYELAALALSYWNGAGTYLPSFTFPRVDIPFANEFDYQNDGYISYARASEAAIRINNAIANLRAEKVFYLGLTEAQKSYLRPYLPARMVVEVQSSEDLDFALSILGPKFEGEVLCPQDSLVEGLILARKQKKKLRPSSGRAPLQKRFLSNADGIAIVEDNGTVDELIVVNYVCAAGMDVVLVKPIEDAELHSLQRLIFKAKHDGSRDAYQSIRKKASRRLKSINFTDYEFATFFTKGFPYGLVLKNIIPISHVHSSVRVDHFIFDSLLYEHLGLSTDSALAFSPEAFAGDEETTDVIQALERNNYLVRSLLGPSATVNAFDFNVGYTPFDLLHICSHGGETDGYFVIEEFQDRYGNAHRLEYEEVIGVSPETKDTVHLVRKILFKRLDGIDWRDNKIAKRPAYVYEDLRKEILAKGKTKNKALRVKANYQIYSSCHIKCFDDIHQGSLHVVAGHGTPLIFNNTCASWYDIAIMFIAAGSRSYIGTLWNVGNATAAKAARTFYREIFETRNILLSFWEMNKAVDNEKYQDIYLLWGLHFSTLDRPHQRHPEKYKRALTLAFISWLRKYSETTDAEVRRNSGRILRFLAREMSALLMNDLPVAFVAQLEALRETPQDAESDFERGVLNSPFSLDFRPPE